MRCIALCLALIGAPAFAEPLFPNSVVSNDLDFIRPEDPTLLGCLAHRGRARAEMPSKGRQGLFLDDVHVLRAEYADQTGLDFYVDPGVGNARAALKAARPVAEAVGRLPGPMRGALSHVVVNTGDFTANAEDQGRFFVVYTENVKKRLRTRDLDETVFHEAVHATLDIPHARSAAWRTAQRKDRAFLTAYGAERPKQEDMAETALFVFAMHTHPGRLPAQVEAAVKQKVPHRYAYLAGLFDQMGPYPARRTGQADCD